jgi:16S rRNA (adenine1518-N6/adenine1519-N6)-dimethyltransferase
MVQNLGDIKAMLAALGLRPKHRLGQNFLHDANQMRRIMEAAAIEPGDLVLEVGPGTGALSVRLLESGARLVAVEIDGDLEPILRRAFEPYPDRARLILGDALAGKHAINPAIIEALGGEPFKLIANLPYNIASPLLIDLVVDHPTMSLAVVLIQREVADRIAALPGGSGGGGKDYGPLTVMIQAMCEVEKIAVLRPGCFWPQPKVDSMVVRLARRNEPLTDDPHALSCLVQRLFGKRRKQIGSILGRDTTLPPGVDPHARPERLSIEQLVALSRQPAIDLPRRGSYDVKS